MRSASLCKVMMVTGALFFAWTVSAEVHINESPIWRRARLVTPGQQIWSFETSYQKYSDRFSAGGELEALGRRYARAVTWRQLVQAETSAAARAEIQAYMRQRHLTDSDVAAVADYQVDRSEVGFSVDWAYGLTRNWMIGFQLPLTRRETRTRSQVELTPQLAQGAGQGRGKSALALSAGSLQQKVGELARAQLENSGYDDIPDQKNSLDWGDISLLSRMGLVSGYHWTWSLQQTVHLPTARNPDLADYLQAGTDDGQVDLGVSSLLDYRQRRWTLGTRVGYMAQLPDVARVRVAPGASAGIDPSVRRDLGDWVWAAVDADYRLERGFQLDLEYAYLSKEADRYQGGSIDGFNYAGLGRDTAQELHQTRLGVLYRLGGLSSRRHVENKWQASLSYTYPWIGRNSVDASRTSLALMSYF